MQVQKSINNYELYSKPEPSVREFRKVKMTKTKRILLNVLLTGIVLSVLVTAVFAANITFDNSVFSTSPTYTLETPGYSSYNSVFSALQPTVTLSIDNRNDDKLIVSVPSVELGKVLEKQNITLDETCVVNHPLDTVVYEGMEVVIDSITYESYEVSTEIPFETKIVECQTVPKGTKSVLKKGQNGTMVSTYRKKIVNGVCESEELVNQVTATQPTAEVVQLGVGGSFKGKDGKTYNYSYYIDVTATCYGKADGSGDITASGTPAREGVIAVDPRVIKLGTKCYVTGNYRDLGVCYAEDTGGAIKGNRIDVYLNGTLEELLQFGRRSMRVYILE